MLHHASYLEQQCYNEQHEQMYSAAIFVLLVQQCERVFVEERRPVGSANKGLFFSNNGRPVCWEGVNVTVLQVVNISGTPFSFATRGGTKRRKVKKCMY